MPLAPRSKTALFNVALPGAEVNILASDIAPLSKPAYFKLNVALAIGGVFRVVRSKSGVTIKEDLNSGVPLVAGSTYAFTIAVDEGESINFCCSTTGGAQTLTNNTGVATGSPISLAAGVNTVVITGAGSFDIALPAGVTGVAASGTATLVGSPVTLPAAATTTIDSGITVGNITVTLTGTLKSLIVDELGD